MILTMEGRTLPEIAKLQLQQSIETYRVQMSLLVQICTVLVVADATTVGYAIQQKLAGIIWVGVIFPVTMFLVIRVIFRSDTSSPGDCNRDRIQIQGQGSPGADEQLRLGQHLCHVLPETESSITHR